MGGSTMCLLNPHLLENFLCDSEAIESSRDPTIDCCKESSKSDSQVLLMIIAVSTRLISSFLPANRDGTGAISPAMRVSEIIYVAL